MRQIKLSESSQQELYHLYQTSNQATVRKRSHCILLSHQGMSMQELSGIFGVQRNTIGRWFNHWLSGQAAGLLIGSGRGRKKKLAGLEAGVIKGYVNEDSRCLATVVAKLEQAHGLQVSKKTLQRFLKTAAV